MTENELFAKLEHEIKTVAGESKMPVIGICGSSLDSMELFAKKIFREDFYQNCCLFFENPSDVEYSKVDVLWTFTNMSSSVPTYFIEYIDENSILNLIDWTESVVNKKNKTAFVKHQKVHIDLKEKFANKAIAQHSVAAFAVGFNPFDIGIGDSLILVSSEIALMGRILNIYDLENVQNVIKTIGFSTIMGNLLTTAGRGVAGGLLKLATKALGPVGMVVGGSVYGAAGTAVTVAFGKSISKVVKQLCKAEINNNLEQVKYLSEHFSEAVTGTAADCLEKGLVKVEDYENSDFDKIDISYEQMKENIKKGNEFFQQFLDKNAELDNEFNRNQDKNNSLSEDMWNAINKI